MERANKWFPVPALDAACADISFIRASGKSAALIVRMHFSRVVDGYEKDLELVFREPLAMKWEEESFGIIDSPQDLPKCAAARFNSWTHPTLVIENSDWADEYAARKYAKDDPRAKSVAHYFLVSMNDLVHILAEAKPDARWVLPDDA
jgi:hypothetical protein